MNRFLNFISTPSGRFDLTDFYFETIDDDKQRKDYHAFSKMLTKNCCCIKKKKKMRTEALYSTYVFNT